MSRNHRPRTAPAKRTHWPERTASDCFDWFTPDDLVRHALAAYYLAARTLNKLPDDPSGDTAVFMNGRYHFAVDLAEVFALRLQQQGFKAGAPGFDESATHDLQQYSTRNDAWLAENQPENIPRISKKSISPDIHYALSTRKCSSPFRSLRCRLRRPRWNGCLRPPSGASVKFNSGRLWLFAIVL